MENIDLSKLGLTKTNDIEELDIKSLGLSKENEDIDLASLGLTKSEPINTAVDMLTSPFKKLADTTTVEEKPKDVPKELTPLEQINADKQGLEYDPIIETVAFPAKAVANKLLTVGGLAIYEGLIQGKNYTISKAKDKDYDPFSPENFSSLLPEKTPALLKVASNVAEMVVDAVASGKLEGAAKNFLVRNTVDTLGKKVIKAGHSEEVAKKVKDFATKKIVEKELGLKPTETNIIGKQPTPQPTNIDEAFAMNLKTRLTPIPPAVKTEPINVTPKTEPIKHNTSEEFVNNKIGTKIEIGDTDMVLGKQIKFIGKDATVDTHIRETPTEIYLNAIGTKKTGDMSSVLEKTGKGTEVINSLKEYADKTGKKLIIPDATNKAYPFWKKFNWLNEDYGVKIKLEDGKIYNPPNTFSYEPNTTNTITTTITAPNIETPAVAQNNQNLEQTAELNRISDVVESLGRENLTPEIIKDLDLSKQYINNPNADFKKINKIQNKLQKVLLDLEDAKYNMEQNFKKEQFKQSYGTTIGNKTISTVMKDMVSAEIPEWNVMKIPDIGEYNDLPEEIKKAFFHKDATRTWDEVEELLERQGIETGLFDYLTQKYINANRLMNTKKYNLGSVSKTQIPTIGALPTESIKETDFKLYQRSLDLANKYKSGKIAESKYRPKKTLGVYYNNTKGKGNIYLKSLNNIEVVSHELVHDIDAQNGLITNLMIDNSPTSTQIKSELRKSYNDNYGLISKSHSKERKLQEGLAMVIQLSAVNPEYVAKNYPKALEFAMNNKILKEFRDEARQIIIDYEGLSAVDKIKSMGYSGIKPSVYGTNTFSKIIKAIKLWGDEQFFDSKARLDLLKEGDEIHSPVYFAGSVAKDIVTGVNGNNLTNKKGSFYVLDENGLPKNVYNENFYTLGEKIDNANSDFQDFLKIRTLYSMVKKRDTYIKGSKEYENLDSILKKNTIPDKTIIDAYNTLNTQVNKDLAVIYDKFINLNIDTLESSRVITPEYAKELRDNWGYSPQNRAKYNELVGDISDDSIKSYQNAKVNNLKKKTGSDLPIVDPYMATIKLMIATNQKAYRQIFNNMVLKVVDKYSDIMQVVPYKAGMEYDPTILMAKNPDGTNAPIQIDKQMKKTIDQIFEIVKPNIIEQLLLLPTQWFTKMTTGAYPLFPLVNIPVDQVTAFVNSRTGQIPFYTGLQTMIRMFKNPQLRGYVDEYSDLFGLNSNTLLGTLEMDNFNFQKSRKNYNPIKMVDKYLTYPSNMSELFTRLTEYVRARHSGSSVAEAKRMANEVTGSFGDKGRWFGRIGQVLIKSIPFFNPTLQISRQSLRSLGRKGNRSKFFLTLLLATLLKVQGDKTILDSEDEEDRRAHMQLMAEQIAMYLYYSKKGNGLYKIKIDQTYLFVGALATMIYNSTKNGYHYNIADYVNAGTSFIPNQVNIFSALTDLMANKDVSGFERMALTSMPHLATIFTHMMFDKKTFPTVMNIVPQSLSRKEPYLQYNERTSDVAMYLGKELNISPIKLDDYFDTILGRGSRLIVRGAEIASNAVRGKENKKNIKAIEGLNPYWQQSYPSSGRFTKKAYDIKNQVTQFKDTLKNNKDEMTPEKRQFVNKNKGLLLRFNLATKLYNKLNKGIRDGKIKDDTKTQLNKLKLEEQLFKIEQKLANKN